MYPHLLRADEEGDGHQHQAVPHVEHQANLDLNSFIRTFLRFQRCNLNKEDEEDAEPPELHCSKDRAKDVALHRFYLASCFFVSFLFLFVSFLFLFVLSLFCLLRCFC